MRRAPPCTAEADGAGKRTADMTHSASIIVRGSRKVENRNIRHLGRTYGGRDYICVSARQQEAKNPGRRGACREKRAQRRPLFSCAAAIHLRRQAPASGMKPAGRSTGFRPADIFEGKTLGGKPVRKIQTRLMRAASSPRSASTRSLKCSPTCLPSTQTIWAMRCFRTVSSGGRGASI